MKIVDYSPIYRGLLSSALERMDRDSPNMFEAPLLRSREFVHHYFESNSHCRLKLLLDGAGELLATLGSETLRLSVGGAMYDASILSNTYSFKSGAISFLLLDWMRRTELGVVFPGNAELTELVSKQSRWQRIDGLTAYYLNWGYPAFAADPDWKKVLKPLARVLMRVDPSRFPARIARRICDSLQVEEVREFDDSMLAGKHPFGFRVDADLGYLNWRFAPTLDYVNYRIFRVTKCGRPRGYVVLADWPHCLVVAHSDGPNPESLAAGTLLAIAAVNTDKRRYRRVILLSRHKAMSALFTEYGFAPKRQQQKFYLASFGKRDLSLDDRHDWLVNADLGDFGTVVGMVYKLP